MQIRLATIKDKPAWDEYVISHPAGFAYHRYAWREAVEQAYGHTGCYLVAEAAKSICGVLPLIEFRIPMRGVELSSLPYCDLGGILADSVAIEVELLNEVQKRLHHGRTKCLELRTLQKDTGTQHGIDQQGKVLMMMALPESAEALLTGLKAKLRSQVKKPVRDGLTAKLGGIELLDDFYKVFAHNMRDLGSPVHSKQWFQCIVTAYAECARVGVVYTPEGIPAAGGIMLLHAKTVSIPWASALSCFNHLNANMFLYWTFLAFAADHGFERFDFGRSTPGEGTFRFKQQWGAKPVPLDWRMLRADGSMELIAASQKGTARKVVETIWRQLPVCLCNAIGPKIRRHVSL